MSETKTISLAGSKELFWEDVDEHAKKNGFTTTSSYVQCILEKDILGMKSKVKDMITYVMLLCIMAMVVLAISLLLLR